MDDATLRNVVAEALKPIHGNPEFIRQVEAGEQDDGPYMFAARAVRNWMVENMAFVVPSPENVEE